MGRKIVFINQATGYLTIDIINEFAKEFDEVALITGSIRIQDKPLESSVIISYIIRYNRGSALKKALSWLIGTVQIHILLLLKYRNFEKFFFTIPPTAYLFTSYFKYHYSVTIFDLYPEALKVYGLSERNILYTWWSAKNKRVFSGAHKVYTLSENMEHNIKQYSPDADVHVIANWSAFSGNKPLKKEHNKFCKDKRLDGKFVVQYSGNIGMTHNVETLIEVAKKLKHHEDLAFQIIGRGERSHIIKNLMDMDELTNCQLLPFRKDEDLYESLCAADLAVITLDDKTSDISLPSKIYNIIAAGLPVMAIAPFNSALSEMVAAYQIGKAFEKEEISAMCEFILELKNNLDLKQELILNTLEASRNFTCENASMYLKTYLNKDLNLI